MCAIVCGRLTLLVRCGNRRPARPRTSLATVRHEVPWHTRPCQSRSRLLIGHTPRSSVPGYWACCQSMLPALSSSSCSPLCRTHPRRACPHRWWAPSGPTRTRPSPRESFGAPSRCGRSADGTGSECLSSDARQRVAFDLLVAVCVGHQRVVLQLLRAGLPLCWRG